MANIGIISVNPGKLTLGALHPEALERRIRAKSVAHRVSDITTSETRRTKYPLLNLFFGICNTTGMKASSRLLLARLVLGAYILSVGIVDFYSYTLIFSLALVIFGGTVILGMLERVSSIFISGVVFYRAYMMFLSSATIDPSFVLLGVIGLVMAILGPGYFSVDSLLRSCIIRMDRYFQRRRREKASHRRMSYKAFHYSEV